MKNLKVSTDGKTRIFHFEGNKDGLMKVLEEEMEKQKNEITWLCDYCGEKQAVDEVHTSSDYDQAICDSCWEHFN